MLQFIFHTDPGHGWLEVDKDLVLKLGTKISTYSYIKDGKVYLEEDCDATAFISDLKDAGLKFTVIPRRVDYDSPVRSYNRVKKEDLRQ